ncbi:MAG: TlpA family protein disulfide reductase [Opitutaceae bacterium]|nr:TlpA family protein disulfide reductase [Opitutaceae bacterium]
MKARILLGFLLTLVPALCADNPGDADYAAIRSLLTERPSPNLSREKARELEMQNRDRVSRMAERFASAFPKHPHRWDAIALAIGQPRQFLGPQAETEKTAWELRRVELREKLLAAPDVPDGVWTGVAERLVYEETGWRGDPVGDLAAAERLLDRMAARVPGSERRKFAEQQFLTVLSHSDPVAAEVRARRLAAESAVNPTVAKMAAGLLAVSEARRTPLELKFTAADGRKVDLAKLRGKVVLVDFWATWCQPCMEEMPNVKRVYEKYHAQGFEIIGISFDKAPGATAREMEKTAAQVVEFAQTNGMPWPHHYDGQYWNNAFGRRFAINSIPAVFLIDQNGLLVTTEAKGDKLEPAVSRLLGL